MMKGAFSVFILLACSVVVFAQETKNPVSSAVREILARQQKNLVAAAEEMPADKYEYKATPQQMSFAHLTIHIAETNNLLCSKVADVPEPKAAELKETDGKDKLVAAMKSSFDFCSTALAKVDDSKLGDELELFGGHRGTRAMAMFIITNALADHYSEAAMYLRLNGMLPPSAQKK
jgi:DinB superfamily